MTKLEKLLLREAEDLGQSYGNNDDWRRGRACELERIVELMSTAGLLTAEATKEIGRYFPSIEPD